MGAIAIIRHPRQLSALSTVVSSCYLDPAASRRLPCINNNDHHAKKGRLQKTCSYYEVNLKHCSVILTSQLYAAVRFHTSSSIKSNSNVCQLFQEIGSRVASKDRNRRASHRYQPSSTANDALQKQSTANLTSDFCKVYLLPDTDSDKKQLIELLISETYDVNQESLSSAIISASSSSSTLRTTDVQKIRQLCTPKYELIFHHILGTAQKDLGVAFLVALRRDARELVHFTKHAAQKQEGDKDGGEIQQHDKVMSFQHLNKLQALERSIHKMLTSLFRPGVLKLQRITYEETPASIIEQIALREAVHPLQSLTDLRTRLGPGRRCFAFFHPALPNKPLVFVHVALLDRIPKSMSDLQQYASAESEQKASCAAFYSITNNEAGLAGVDLGNHLIKSVVQVLQDEFSTLQTFCTLSPIPKFRNWLEGKLVRYHKGLVNDGPFTQQELYQLEGIFASKTYLLDLLETTKSPSWHIDRPYLVDKLEPLLMKLAAYYLTIESHRGRLLCPVAKFHIRNGAEMYRLNYMGDTSIKGLRTSCGIMINYRYVLDNIEDNSVNYEMNGKFAVKDGVSCWLNEHDDK